MNYKEYEQSIIEASAKYKPALKHHVEALLVGERKDSFDLRPDGHVTQEIRPRMARSLFEEFFYWFKQYLSIHMFLIHSDPDEMPDISLITRWFVREYLSCRKGKPLHEYMRLFPQFMSRKLEAYGLDKICLWPLTRSHRYRHYFYKACTEYAKGIASDSELSLAVGEDANHAFLTTVSSGLQVAYVKLLCSWKKVGKALSSPIQESVSLEVDNIMIDVTLLQYYMERRAKVDYFQVGPALYRSLPFGQFEDLYVLDHHQAKQGITCQSSKGKQRLC